MLILLHGPPKSGRNTVINYLVQTKGYQKLTYSPNLFNYIITFGNWKTNYITIITNINDWSLYKKRPFSRLIVLFAPSNSSWRKHNDDTFYSKINLYEDAHKLCNFGTIEDLQLKIQGCLKKIRPQWDTYFMNIAIAVSSRANCMKGKVGCLVVKGNKILGTGYNGTPHKMTNCYENGCERCNNGLKGGFGLESCLCVHAEENALLFVGMERATGSVLYVTRFPCVLCCRKIMQMGVVEIVYLAKYGVTDEVVNGILKSAKINVRHLEL